MQAFHSSISLLNRSQALREMQEQSPPFFGYKSLQVRQFAFLTIQLVPQFTPF